MVLRMGSRRALGGGDPAVPTLLWNLVMLPRSGIPPQDVCDGQLELLILRARALDRS